jgi:alanine racemase
LTQKSGPPDIETGARLTIDLAAIQANYRLLAARAAPAECGAVVKADAYGLGAVSVSKALWNAGARTFFVAHVFEARAVRTALPHSVIYVLSGFSRGAPPALAEIGARPVLGSMDEIEEWSAFVGAGNLPGDAAIHIDTGMNRLGLTFEQASYVAGKPLGFRPTLVMSHPACADIPDHPANARQLERFEEASGLFPGVAASLANSAATLTGGKMRFDLCRPGIALYGGNPFTSDENPMRPVVKLEAKVVQIRTAEKGESVGYGAMQTVSRPTLLAILSVGYADGVMRAAGSTDMRKGADAVIAGLLCPFVGRISMDLAAVDITSLPAGSVNRGDTATILGDGITIDEFGAIAGTFSYEVLTRLGQRFTRTYIG